MNTQLNIVSWAVVAAALAIPALTLAQAPSPGATQGAASIPDFTGIWWHPSLPGPEPLDSGPTTVRNLSRRNGVSNYDQLVGDYNNPILQPWAAEVVKKHGEMSKAGTTYPSPSNQCWPMPVPYIYKNFGLQVLQHPDRVTFLYEQDHEFRNVYLNRPHPAQVKQSWYGDAIGRYDGDTLVVDTIGQKHGPFSMLDLFGTPFSDALHVVERYRLVPYEEAKDGLSRDERESSRAGRDAVDVNYRGMHLQIQYTVEDPNVFTTPWSATVTYRPGLNPWPETVCAENRMEYYHGANSKESEVPKALKPDF